MQHTLTCGLVTIRKYNMPYERLLRSPSASFRTCRELGKLASISCVKQSNKAFSNLSLFRGQLLFASAD